VSTTSSYLDLDTGNANLYTDHNIHNKTTSTTCSPPHALGYINLDTGTKVSLSFSASAFSIVKVFATQHCP
jgi:hypothetical protein